MARRRRRSPVNRRLAAAGAAEVAFGAMLGWPFALAVSRPEDLAKLGIKSGARLRQWHLDHVMLGGLTMTAASAVDDLPARVAVPLAVGGWTNAAAFGVLAFRPDAKDSALYKAGAVASFVAVSGSWVAVAALAARRARS